MPHDRRRTSPIWRTAWAELRTKYASPSVVLRNVLQPLAQIVVYSVIFTNIIGHGGVKDVPGGYTVYLCSLLIPWMAFSECINRGTISFVSHAQYLVKLPIPEQVFMAQTVLSSGLTLAISYTIFLIAAVWMGQPATWHRALLPIPLGFVLAYAFGVSLLLGTVNAFIRDTATVATPCSRSGSGCTRSSTRPRPCRSGCRRPCPETRCATVVHGDPGPGALRAPAGAGALGPDGRTGPRLSCGLGYPHPPVAPP